MNEPPYPETIDSETELEAWMTRPTLALIDYMPLLQGPLVVLGAGGKMGPSLCKLARRAAEAAGRKLDIIAVSRYSDEASRQELDQAGVRTLPGDLMDRAFVRSLPDAGAVVYLVGLKFGTDKDPAQTWAVNTLIPSMVCERYKGTRFVALSSGNVYPLVPVSSGGSEEGAALTPLGEYANACVARERIFEYSAARYGLSGVLIRLNYAVDLRYGVFVDLATRIWAGEPIDLTTGYVNCIWQRDANDLILRALSKARRPPFPLNVTGTEVLSIRNVSERLAEYMSRAVRFEGQESETALLSDTTRMVKLLDAPLTPIDRVLLWTADWVARGRTMWDRPTHFEVRDGSY